MCAVMRKAAKSKIYFLVDIGYRSNAPVMHSFLPTVSYV
jgi:hypothetical protein